MSKAKLPEVLSAREGSQADQIWSLLRAAYLSKKPDVSITDLVEKTAGRPVLYAYKNYAGSRVSHINKLLAHKGVGYRVKPGVARGTYAITVHTV